MAKRPKTDKQQRIKALNALQAHELEAKAITMNLSPAPNLKKAQLVKLILTKPAAKVSAKEKTLAEELKAKKKKKKTTKNKKKTEEVYEEQEEEGDEEDLSAEESDYEEEEDHQDNAAETLSALATHMASLDHSTSFNKKVVLLIGTEQRPKANRVLKNFMMRVRDSKSYTLIPVFKRHVNGLLEHFGDLVDTLVSNGDFFGGHDPTTVPMHFRSYVRFFLSHVAALHFLDIPLRRWQGRCISGLAEAIRGGSLALDTDTKKLSKIPCDDMLTMAIKASMPSKTARQGRLERISARKNKKSGSSKKVIKKKKR